MRLRLLVVCAALLSALPAVAQISGYVYGSDSKPLANVVVRAHRPETISELRDRLAAGTARAALATATTDEKGAFKLDPKTTGVIAIAVAATGHLPIEQRELANEKDIAILLAAAKPVRGHVTLNGKPLAGATVIAAGEVPFTTTTDARGDYTLPILDDSVVWALSVFHPDAGAATVWKKERVVPDFDLRAAPMAGRVVHANGKPAAGAKLFVDGWPVGRSGDDGAFSIPLVTGREQQIQAVSGELQGTAERGNDQMVITLAPQRVIDVTVRDAAKSPLAGVVVRATADYGEPMSDYTRRVASAVSDDKGRARLIAAPEDIWVSATGANGSAFETTEATGDGKVEIALTAAPASYVRGVLRDEEQRPVAAGRVFSTYGPQTILYSPTTTQKHTISAADGSFRLPAPSSPIGPMRVLALHPDYAIGESADIESASASKPLVIVMPKGIAVEGSVVTADGKAVEGVSVIPVEQSNIARPDSAASSWLGRFEPWVRSDAAGRFSLHLRPKTHELVFGGKHYQSLLVSDVEPRRGMEPLRIVLEPGVEIRGRVVSKRPLGEYETRVIASPAEYEGYFYAPIDAEGRFVFTALRPGTYKVGLGTSIRVVRAPATDVILELQTKVDVRGSVIDKSSGAPLTKFNVTAMPLSDDGGHEGEQFEHGEGKFMLPVSPGRVRIEATAEGYLPSDSEFLTIDPEKPPAELRLALQRGRAIRGRVTSSEGDPVDASVMLRDDDGESFASAQTGEDGSYEVTGIPPSAMSIFATAQEFVFARKAVPAGNADLRIDLELSAGLKLAGRVMKEDGSPAASVNVEASTLAHGADSQYAETDADGTFSMQGLSEALYEVNASSTDGFATIPKVDPRNAAPLVLTLRKPGTGRVRGTVSGLSGTLRGDVTATAIDQRSATGRIDRDGNYVITDVPVGQVTLRATARSGKSQIVSRAVTVEVVPDGEATVDLVFEQGIDVRGIVTRNGQPAVAADVLFQLERDNPGLWRTTTGDDGSYEIRGLERGMYQIAVATFHDTNMSKRQIIDSPSTIDIQIDGTRIEGRVVDDDRTPLANVKIDITRLDDNSAIAASTDAAGIFSAQAIGGARYRLFPSKSGYVARSVDTVGGGEPLTIAMTRADALRVRVVDGRDGSTLDAWAEAHDDAGRIIARSGQTAADGTVRLPVGRGTFRISASAPGFSSQSTRVTVPSASEVRITLTPGGVVQIDAPADATALVRFLLPSGEAYIHCLCDGQHELRLTGASTRINSMASGTYTLQLIDANGRASRGYPVMVREGEVTRVRVE